MSRCFPYPPPGYTLSSARKEASIESIKLQRENQKDKEKRKETKEERKERKERRKEKKEKRKERKEKKYETKLDSDKSCIVNDQIGPKTLLDSKDELFIQKREDYIGQKIRLDSKDELVIQKREAESDQFERSSLTEEHGLPNSLPVPSSSYDSTENNKKRKRHSSSTDGSQVHGKPILIRLPSKRKSEFHSLANGQQPCSISRQTASSVQLNDDTRVRGRPETCNIELGLNPRNSGKEICSTSGQNIDTFTPGKTGLGSLPKAVLNPMQGVEDLLGKLFPPPLQDASLYPADSDWLFQSRRKGDERAQKRRISGSDGLHCARSSGLWPRAEYLPEIDVIALPFVLPY